MKQHKKHIKKILLFAVLALCILAIIVYSKGIFFAESNEKISADLLEQLSASTPDSFLKIIAQYYEEPIGVDYDLLNDLDATILCELQLIYGLAIEIPAGHIEEFSQSERVKSLSPDREVRACLDVASSTMGKHYYVPYYNLTSNGITVAVLDSGIIASDEFVGRTGNNRIVANIDLVQDQPLLGHDYYGHGSYVAGIIAMKTHYDESGNISFSGIAPDASIASIRVLDASGKGKVSTVIKGIEWCVDHALPYRIKVINLSLSHPIYESFSTDPLTQACERAWESGLVVIAAAGNHGQDSNGYGTIGSPANDPTLISVGSVNDLDTVNKDDDLLPTFSSKGPALIDYILKPDILATGTSVFSVRAPGSYLDSSYNENRVSLDGGISYPYFRLNGTSVSSAIASGAVAIMLEKEPFLSPSTVKARLMRSADKSFKANIYHRGAGYLNIEEALLDSGIALSSLSPKVFRTDSNIGLENIRWGPGFLEDQEIWGSSISWEENDIYDDLTVWGNTALTDYQNIWTSGNHEENTMTQ